MQFRFAASSVLCKIYSAGYSIERSMCRKRRRLHQFPDGDVRSRMRWCGRLGIYPNHCRQMRQSHRGEMRQSSARGGWVCTLVHKHTNIHMYTHLYMYVGIGTCSSWSQWNWHQHRLHRVPFLSRNFKRILTILNYRTVRVMTVHLDKKFVK